MYTVHQAESQIVHYIKSQIIKVRSRTKYKVGSEIVSVMSSLSYKVKKIKLSSSGPGPGPIINSELKKHEKS